MINLTNPEPRPDVYRVDLTFFSADVEHRVAICVLQAYDAAGERISGLRRRLEFRDDTPITFAQFASGTGGGQFRNAVEAWLATLSGTGGSVA